MYYLSILVIFLIYHYTASQPVGLHEQKEKRFSFWICVILVMMAAFRSDMVGADTLAYRMDYEGLEYYHDFDSLVD